MLDHTTPSPPSPSDSERACFVGATMISTTRGLLCIADLARLSTKRDSEAERFADHTARIEQKAAVQLQRVDALIGELLSAFGATDTEDLTAQLVLQRAAFVDVQASLIAMQAESFAEALAAMLPKVLTRASTGEVVERAIVRAWQASTATAFVDVQIDSQIVTVDNVESEIPVRVRCTPEHVFIGPDGETAALDLEGVSIYRIGEDEGFTAWDVPSVTTYDAPETLAVYDIEVEGDVPAYCVSPHDACCPALVHNSKHRVCVHCNDKKGWFEKSAAHTDVWVECTRCEAEDSPRSLPVERVFSKAQTDYATRVITDPATLEEQSFTAPVNWSDQAATILATKYARKTGVPAGAFPEHHDLQERVTLAGERGAETDARQIFGRLAGCWAHWGLKLGYFDERNAQAFREEITAMLEQQVAAPNSPQWFNTGLAWAYGITGRAQGHYAARFGRDVIVHGEGVAECTDAYTRPQAHACFIQSVEDDLVGDNGILDLLQREGRLFKFGSGTGTNYSSLRAKGEVLSGGGTSSGLMSFLKVLDASAGAIKSGGGTRRAAKMVVVDVDHPDIEDFITWKQREEHKILVLREGGIGDPTSFEDEATNTVSGQNGNNSVRITDAFMHAVEAGASFDLTARTTGETMRTVDAQALWGKLCGAAWSCADPGVQFHDTINKWNTCKEDGEILGTNPCAEYTFLDDTACNLASLNLVKFMLDDAFDYERFAHATRLWTIVLDITVSMAGYPSERIAERSQEYRTLGLGYANLGGLLMRRGIPYASDEGRLLCADLTSFEGAVSWRTSAELAELLGPFPAFERNRESVLEVLQLHLAASLKHCASGGAGGRWSAVLPAVFEHGARNAQCTLLAPTGTIGLVMDCDTTGIEPDFALVKRKRLAGGGYFKLVNTALLQGLENLGYSDSEIASIERHCKGSGTLYNALDIAPWDLSQVGFTYTMLEKIEDGLSAAFHIRDVINPRALGLDECKVFGLSEEALTAPGFDLLTALGFTETRVRRANEYACGTGNVKHAPHLRAEHVAIFDCANDIDWRGHLGMMAAAQPFLCGAISKTVNLPSDADIDVISDCYKWGHEHGLKAIAVYRDKSKATQVLTTASPDEQAVANAADLEAAVAAVQRPSFTVRPSDFDDESGPQTLTGARLDEYMAAVADSVEGEMRRMSATFKGAPMAEWDNRELAGVPYRGQREAPPAIRNGGVTAKLKVAGESHYITANSFEDGRLCELFVNCGKQGGAVAGWANAFGVAVSLYLQVGGDPEPLIEKLRYQRFEPAGFVTGAPLGIRSATSPVDAIAQFLERLLEGLPAPTSECAGAEPLAVPVEAAEQAPEPRSHRATGAVCSVCRSTNLESSGTCFTCHDCGANTGCG